MWQKGIFYSTFFSIKTGKIKFLFLNNGSDNSRKHQSKHFNTIYDKIIVRNNFTKKKYILACKMGCLGPVKLSWFSPQSFLRLTEILCI